MKKKDYPTILEFVEALEHEANIYRLCRILKNLETPVPAIAKLLTLAPVLRHFVHLNLDAISFSILLI